MALEFIGNDSSNEAVSFTNVSNLSTTGQAITIESIWEIDNFASGGGGFRHVYGGDGTTGGKHWQLWVDSSGNTSVRFICGGTQQNTSAGSVVSTGTIYHHFVTYDGSTIQEWLDGVDNGFKAATGNLDALSDFWVGDNPTLDPREWDGIIYRVRVWHRVLTKAEMDMAQSIKGPDGLFDGLVGWWEFDESSPGTALSAVNYDVIDLSGNEVNGRAAAGAFRPDYVETILQKRKPV